VLLEAHHNEVLREKGPETMSTVRKEAESVFNGRESVQEGQGARPLPAVLQEHSGLRLAGQERRAPGGFKTHISRLLLWGAGLGPVAVVIVDRVLHFFGICLGH